MDTPSPTDADTAVDDAISAQGFHVIGVEADNDENLGLCYTAGLAERGHPDYVVATLIAEGSGGTLLAEAARQAMLGNPIGTGRQMIDGATDRTWVLDIPAAQARALMPLASERFRRSVIAPNRPFRARQIVWAYQGYFPWEEGYDGPEGIQPLYGTPPRPLRP